MAEPWWEYFDHRWFLPKPSYAVLPARLVRKDESPPRRRALARPVQEAPRIEGCSASSLRPEPPARCTLMRQTCYSPYLVEPPLRLNGIGKINALSRAADLLSGKAAFVAPKIRNPSN